MQNIGALETMGDFTRIEVIDHTLDGKGREYVKWNNVKMHVTISVQDDGRTLKIFLQDILGGAGSHDTRPLDETP